MSACSMGVVEPLSETAFCAAACAALRSAGDMMALPLTVTLMFGPVASASPQKHIAQEGSSRCAALKALMASAWLNPKAITIP
jgi:hypothetical protein